jgi:hypothetical protein
MIDPPWWMNHTPEDDHRAAWQSKVIRWLLRTQPTPIVEAVLLGYLEGDARAVACFERASALMRAQEYAAVSRGAGKLTKRVSPGWTRIGEASD